MQKYSAALCCFSQVLLPALPLLHPWQRENRTLVLHSAYDAVAVTNLSSLLLIFQPVLINLQVTYGFLCPQKGFLQLNVPVLYDQTKVWRGIFNKHQDPFLSLECVVFLPQ